MKIAYQGVAGSYSESCAKKMYPESETIPCKTFDECFERSSKDNSIKSLIPIPHSNPVPTSLTWFFSLNIDYISPL